MIRLFSNSNKKFLQAIDKSENELNKFLSENWNNFFPQFSYVSSEFTLDGNVRSKGTSGRIDILAFNTKSKTFVIIELKKNSDKNIRNQASDYKDFVEDNFAEIYLLTSQKFGIKLPNYTDVKKEIELVMIAKQFSQTDIQKASKSEGRITLIRYLWFEEELLLIDYLNNDPLEILERENTRKIEKIKAIIDNKPTNDVPTEIDMFFHKKPEAKRLFYIFYELLKSKSDLIIEIQQTKVKLSTKKETFSVMGFGGKTGRKAFLQINTNIASITSLKNIVIDDRIRPGQKKKGSIGTERFEIYIKNEKEIMLIFENIKLSI
ncbi:hypothetical protein EV196_1102 [Mariniflexile fucanivorans]|uniref:Uncharacterized protein n=1 Tax=Mariniflexile fucanivorans TaxID=264023 RepID=A0A4R1RBP6_9FLAO|nr:hypothetical protein [Mariniflexile fucanivorans]TCL63050.1 hypothetical protein EV196_1102 [Mariniflexile fucanivorans]